LLFFFEFFSYLLLSFKHIIFEFFSYLLLSFKHIIWDLFFYDIIFLFFFFALVVLLAADFLYPSLFFLYCVVQYYRYYYQKPIRTMLTHWGRITVLYLVLFFCWYLLLPVCWAILKIKVLHFNFFNFIVYFFPIFTFDFTVYFSIFFDNLLEVFSNLVFFVLEVFSNLVFFVLEEVYNIVTLLIIFFSKILGAQNSVVPVAHIFPISAIITAIIIVITAIIIVMFFQELCVTWLFIGNEVLEILKKVLKKVLPLCRKAPRLLQEKLRQMSNKKHQNNNIILLALIIVVLISCAIGFFFIEIFTYCYNKIYKKETNRSVVDPVEKKNEKNTAGLETIALDTKTNIPCTEATFAFNDCGPFWDRWYKLRREINLTPPQQQQREPQQQQRPPRQPAQQPQQQQRPPRQPAQQPQQQPSEERPRNSKRGW